MAGNVNLMLHCWLQLDAQQEILQNLFVSVLHEITHNNLKIVNTSLAYVGSLLTYMRSYS